MHKININGITRYMTPEEEARFAQEMANLPQPEHTPEERIATLEADNAALKEALELLLSGVTEDG